MEAGEVVVRLKGDATELNKSFSQAQSAANSFKNFLLGFASITAFITLSKQIVNIGLDFEKSMKNVQAVLGETNEGMQKLIDTAREMGKSTLFSAKEVGDAMYYLASAGYNTQEVMDSLTGVLNMATATQSDLAFSTNTVVNTLNQFGLKASEANRVANVFAATIAGSQATIERLSDSMAYVGTIANTLGMSLEETSAALGLLYNAGFKASQAGTGLRQALSSLINPTGEAKKVLEELGVTITNADGTMRPFIDIVRDLGSAGMTTEQAFRLFGDRAAAVMVYLSQNVDQLEEFTRAVTDTQKASEQASIQLDSVGGQFKQLGNTIKEAALTIWEVLGPALGQLAEWLRLGILGLMDFGGQLGDWLGKLIYETLPQFIEGVKTKINEFVEHIKELPQIFIDTITGYFDKIKATGNELVGKLATGISEKYEGFKKVVTELWNIITTVANTNASKVLEVGKAIVQGIWQGIQNSTDWLLNLLRSWVGNILDWLKRLFGIGSPSEITTGYGINIVEGFITGIKKTIPDFKEALGLLSLKEKDFNINKIGIGGGYNNIIQPPILTPSSINNVINIHIGNYSAPISPEELAQKISDVVGDNLRKHII